MYRFFFKPLIDRIAAVLLLILLSPLLLIAIAVAAFSSRGNPFFIHPRPGKDGQPIKVYKLKTMGPAFDAAGRKRSNAERIGTVGNWLRKSSVDEIPQLIGVIGGSLSLVGPRPLEMRYLPHYTKEQNRRHEVLPGITGLAQVSGRNKLSWDEKFALDLEYVDNQSFMLDMKILFKTAMQIFRRSDVNAAEGKTVDPFVE